MVYFQSMQNGETSNGDLSRKIDSLSGHVETLTGKVDSLAGSVGTLSGTVQDVLDVINDFSTRMDERFVGVESDIKDIKGGIKEMKSTMTTMVTMDYLDDKLADQMGDFVIAMRKGDHKVRALIEVLRDRKIITEDDAKRILGMEPFPQLSV